MSSQQQLLTNSVHILLKNSAKKYDWLLCVISGYKPQLVEGNVTVYFSCPQGYSIQVMELSCKVSVYTADIFILLRRNNNLLYLIVV